MVFSSTTTKIAHVASVACNLSSYDEGSAYPIPPPLLHVTSNVCGPWTVMLVILGGKGRDSAGASSDEATVTYEEKGP